MKKIITFILLITMIFTTTACEVKEEQTTELSTSAETIIESVIEKQDNIVPQEVLSVLTSEQWKNINSASFLETLNFHIDYSCNINEDMYTWSITPTEKSNIYHIVINKDDQFVYKIELKKKSPEKWDITFLSNAQNSPLNQKFLRISDYDNMIIISIYKEAKKLLSDYLTNGFIRVEGNSIRNNDALQYIYAKFQKCINYLDSKEILSKFLILPEIAVSITQKSTDKLGNIQESTRIPCQYDVNGNIVALSSKFYDFSYSLPDVLFFIKNTNDLCYIEYNAENQIEKIWIGFKTHDKNIVDSILIPTYNESGNIVQFLIKTNHNDYINTLTYDSNGNLAKIEGVVYNPYGRLKYAPGTVTFSYDSNNKIVERKIYFEESPSKYTYTYSYNADGLLIKIDTEQIGFNNTLTHDTIEIQNITDSKGRPSSSIIYSTEDKENGIVSHSIDYTYHDLYFYIDK